MARFHASATYCTRGGNPGSWIMGGEIEAVTMTEAMAEADRRLAKARPGISKVDITVTTVRERN